MKFRSLLFGAMLLAATPAVFAATSDDMQIYSGRFDNGWGDTWSWMPHYATNNPVYTSNSVFVASNSVACVPSAPFVVWLLKNTTTTVDATLYTNVSFWIDGGANGGQNISVSGELNGSSSGLPSVSVTAPTNSWKQVIISLAALGVNKTNLTGFLFNNGTSTQPFFIDDMRLIAAPKPATVHVSVNASQAVRTVSGRIFAINTGAGDGNLNTPATKAILNDIGSTCLRWPGGSYGDEYHWTNEPSGGSHSTDFIALATNAHSQAFIIVNYGTSTPEEAAYGVRMFNVTNHSNFKYWEIGNEINGVWEPDNNTNAPYKAHDPWTYAMRFKDYYTQMKAVDPTIKIGAVVDPTEDGYANNNDHPVVNPRTGVTHYGWTPVMLTYMRSNNCLPDFVIEHKYGPSAGDTLNLLWSSSWATDAANLRQMLNDYLGSAGTNVTLECTEAGVHESSTIQSVSLISGLFYADSVGQILQTEFNSRVWWNLRNGQGTVADPDPANYGWRTNANGSFLDDGGIVYGLGGVGSAYPKYYCAKLMPQFARDGDTVVRATSDYPLLATYAVMRTNGTLTLLVINKSSSSNLTANFNLSGYVPYGNAAVYSYGIPQDEAARTGVGSPDIAQTNFIGAAASFSATFAPFSATVMAMSPANQPPVAPTSLVATASNAVVSLSWNGSAGADSYIVKRSPTSGSGYVTIASGVTGTSYLDSGVVGGKTYYYVVAATNVYGVSPDATEAGATLPPIATITVNTVGTLNGNGKTFLEATGNSLNEATLAANIATAFANNTGGVWNFDGIAFNVTSGQTIALNYGTSPANNLILTLTEGTGGTGINQGNIGGEATSGAFELGLGGNAATRTFTPNKPLLTVAIFNTDRNDATRIPVLTVTFQDTTTASTSGANADNVYFHGLSGTASNPIVSFAISQNNFIRYDDLAFIVAKLPAPQNVIATMGNANVALAWSAVSNAAVYYVKRSNASSNFTTIATNLTLTFTNSGLTNGTLYYFVVSAGNAFGESTNSAQVSARPTSSAPVGLDVINAPGQLQFSWPTDHTGWQLQSQTNNLGGGLGTNWVSVPASMQTTQMTVPLGSTNGSVFFRLVRPY